jgi:PEP-CTERM motif
MSIWPSNRVSPGSKKMSCGFATPLSVGTLDINFPGVSMMNRSVFLSLAAGILASLAFASPSQAATQNVTANFTVTGGGTASDIEIIFSGAITDVTITSTNLTITPPFFSGDNVILNFTPASSGFVNFTETGSGVGTSQFELTGVTGNVTASNLAVTFASVPEPTSIALLGIGMTGFLAFRRLFKRTAVA